MTSRFFLTLGINKGYFHNNENGKYTINEIAIICNNLAEDYYKNNGVYVTFSVLEGTTFYSKEWGCPVNGEETIIITGVANPSFVKLDDWKQGVLHLAKEIKKVLEQTTCTVEFVASELHYLT